jgi:tripartite-type tricarboxylate transporter receptor subunit TctC
MTGSTWVSAGLGVLLGAEPASLSSPEFAALIKRDLARWKKVAHETGIHL